VAEGSRVRFEQLQYLVAAVKEGSLRRAAASLDLSQPTVSDQLRRLEEELGLVLMTRGSHGVRPTYAAELIMPHVLSALRAESAIRAEASAVSGLTSGRIDIGTISAASTRLLPEVVAQFRITHPNVQFRVNECGSMDVKQGVSKGDFDLGIVSRFEVDGSQGDDLRVIDLRRGRIVLAIPEKHPLAEKPRVATKDLVGQPMIVMPRGTLLRDAYERLSQEVETEPVYFTNTTESAQQLVRTGIGCALAHTLASTTLSRPGVVLATLDVPWTATQMSVVMRSGEQPSRAAQGFLQLLRASEVDTRD
jgi:DNA-binding transcriptional LysR family regulator